jgi:hypothetical protein
VSFNNEINNKKIHRMHIFSFDFSMSKPSVCYYNTDIKQMEFACWPMQLDEKSENILKEVNVIVYNRNLNTISKKDNYDNNSLILEHTVRALNLSKMISDYIISKTNDMGSVTIATEGLSFNSKGNAALDLSGYKYTLLTKLYDIGVRKIYTYSPISIKSIAGCAKRGMYGKDMMINAIKNENPTQHKLIHTLIYESNKLKKKRAYVHCVDDLVDSYWTLQTLINKENIKL